MEGLRIIDLSKDEKPSDFESTALILITGITESTLNDAITLAESARKSERVTIGIPEGGIDSGNEDMKRFADIADAVIFSRGKTEDIAPRIANGLLHFKRDNNIEILRGIFRNAGTVRYGTGSGDDIESATRKVAEMCGDIHGAKTAVYQSISPEGAKKFTRARIRLKIFAVMMLGFLLAFAVTARTENSRQAFSLSCMTLVIRIGKNFSRMKTQRT